MSYCTECGAECREGKFCERCGAELSPVLPEEAGERNNFPFIPVIILVIAAAAVFFCIRIISDQTTTTDKYLAFSLIFKNAYQAPEALENLSAEINSIAKRVIFLKVGGDRVFN